MRIEQKVWDRSTRLFHWLNFLCVVGLASVGTVILFAGDLDVSNDGKVALKTLHVWIGYAFVLNLVWRLVWGFVGGRHARWSAILPGGKGYAAALREDVRHLVAGEPAREVGHGALGRLAVTVMLLALLIQSGTGLLLAGADVYMPPFGGYFAAWVASPDKDPSGVKPYAPDTVNADSWAQMRAFRAPVASTHLVGYQVLLVLILLHVVAVVTVEVRTGGDRISAMFTGRRSR